MSGGRWLPLILVALFSGLFAYFNAGQRVALGLGFVTLYRIPFVAVVFTAFLLGLVTMFLVSLSHDRRMRQLLRDKEDAARQRRFTESPPPSWHRTAPSEHESKM